MTNLQRFQLYISLKITHQKISIEVIFYQFDKLITFIQIQLMKSRSIRDDNRLIFDYFGIIKKLNPRPLCVSKNANNNFNNPILKATQASALTKKALLKPFQKHRSIKLCHQKRLKTEKIDSERGEDSNFVFSSLGITSMKVYNSIKQMKENNSHQNHKPNDCLEQENRIQHFSRKHSSSAKSCRMNIVKKGITYPCSTQRGPNLSFMPTSCKINKLGSFEYQTIRLEYKSGTVKTQNYEDFFIPHQTITAKRERNSCNTRIHSAFCCKDKLKVNQKMNKQNKAHYHTNEDQFKGWDFEADGDIL